jgi:hypothetical protein
MNTARMYSSLYTKFTTEMKQSELFGTISIIVIMAIFSYFALSIGLKRRNEDGDLDLSWYNLRLLVGGVFGGLGAIVTIIRLLMEIVFL